MNGWTSALHLFDYNLDRLGLGTIDAPEWKIPDRSRAYVARAVAARAGLWGNHGYEADYAFVWTDGDGQPLDGTNRYELRLEQLPPVDAFWSLTMYDVPEFYLVANPIDRYSIGDRTPGLQTDADGSLTIYLQQHAPGPTRRPTGCRRPPGRSARSCACTSPSSQSWTGPTSCPPSAGSASPATAVPEEGLEPGPIPLTDLGDGRTEMDHRGGPADEPHGTGEPVRPAGRAPGLNSWKGEPMSTEHNVVVTRVLDAPVEPVWRAWSESEQMMRWWGPTGFTCPVARMDVREGGTSLVCMRSPDGHDICNTWTYERVAPMRELEFVQRFADSDGNTLAPAALGLPPDIPAEVRHVVAFRSAGEARTELTVTEYGYPSAQIVELSKAGMEQCLDKLAAVV